MNIIHQRALYGIALLFTLVFSSVYTQAQTCNAGPGAAGFNTAGGFGGCVMSLYIVYNCGSGPIGITCNMAAGGDGFDLPTGCCVVSVQVTTPQQGAYTVDASTPNVSPPTGSWIFAPNICDDHPVTNIDWVFPMGPCRPGTIHIN